MPSGHRPPIPPPIARVALSGTYQGHHWTTVYYLNLTGSGITAADLNTLATDIATAWNTRFGANVTNTVILTEVAIVYVPSVGNEVNGVWTGSHTGTGGGVEIENAGTCLVVNWKISAYYRGGHPRTYMPGLAQVQVTNGSAVAAGAITTYTTAWSGFLADNNGFTTTNISGVQMGTLSYQTGNSWRTTPLFRPYTGVAIRSVVGSQRRRITA